MTTDRASILDLLNQRRTQEAIARCSEALAVDPASAELSFLLGLAFEQAGEAARAAEALERSAAADPRRLETLGTLANLHSRAQRHADAATRLEQAKALDPRHPSVRFNLGNALFALGKATAAQAEYEAAVELKPDHHGAWGQLAVVLLALQRAEDALVCVRRALALQEASIEHRLTEAACLVQLGRWAGAIAGYREVLRLAPSDWRGHAGLAGALTGIGAAQAAEAGYLEAVRLAPSPTQAAATWSNYLMSLQYRDDVSAERLIEAHRAFQRYQPCLPRAPLAPKNGKMKVGFVSADFCGHPVGRFSLPVLSGLDRDRFTVFAYSATPAEDALSQTIRASVDGWREIRGLTAQDATALVRKDEIDVLVDLSGHTGARRLDLFALRPAATQIGWLGYPGPYAWPGVDWRISDEVVDPASETGFGDAVIRLSRTPLAHTPSSPPPPAADPPPLSQRRLTFGSFNNLAKLDPGTFAQWRSLLEAFPEAELVLKGKGAGDAAFTARLDHEFGAVRSRVRTIDWMAAESDHRARYSEIDVALDPLTYNGTTTTCEALAAGVPVLSRRGDRPAARMGQSLLKTATLSGWTQAEDTEAIAFLRANLPLIDRTAIRERVTRSPLCDSASFVREFSDALLSSTSQDATGSGAG